MDDKIAKLIDDYQPTEKTIQLVRSVPKVFIVGIAAAGKDSLKRRVIAMGGFYELVTNTTRPPRSNSGQLEKDGVEYYFIDKQKAVDMLMNHDFVEAKWIHRQNLYGTSVDEFRKAKEKDQVVITDIDVAGVDEYMKIAPESTTPIFVLPPDFDTWQQRFKARYEGGLGEGEFQNRLRTAAQEIEHVLDKHYYSIVINDDLDDSVQQVASIVAGEPQSDMSLHRSIKVARQLLEDIRTSTR